MVRKSSSLYFDDISSYGKCHYMGTKFHLVKELNIYLPFNRQARKKSSICRETGNLAELFRGQGKKQLGTNHPEGGLALKESLNVHEAE